MTKNMTSSDRAETTKGDNEQALQYRTTAFGRFTSHLDPGKQYTTARDILVALTKASREEVVELLAEMKVAAEHNSRMSALARIVGHYEERRARPSFKKWLNGTVLGGKPGKIFGEDLDDALMWKSSDGKVANLLWLLKHDSATAIAALLDRCADGNTERAEAALVGLIFDGRRDDAINCLLTGEPSRGLRLVIRGDSFGCNRVRPWADGEFAALFQRVKCGPSGVDTTRKVLVDLQARVPDPEGYWWEAYHYLEPDGVMIEDREVHELVVPRFDGGEPLVIGVVDVEGVADLPEEPTA